jgi:hypothetical protein
MMVMVIIIAMPIIGGGADVGDIAECDRDSFLDIFCIVRAKFLDYARRH